MTTDDTRPTREQIDRAVGAVLFNAMNHPAPAAVLGKSIAPLRAKVTDAVLALLDAQPTAAEAWDEGHTAGQANEHEHRPGRQVTNPHRAGGDR